MIILDACVLIAHLEAGHVHARQAFEILDTEDTLVIHPLTLAECLVGAVRTGQEGVFRSALERIGINIWTPDNDHPYRLARLRADYHLTMPDCCVLDAARHTSATLATFDAALSDAATRLNVQTVGLVPA